MRRGSLDPPSSRRSASWLAASAREILPPTTPRHAYRGRSAHRLPVPGVDHRLGRALIAEDRAAQGTQRIGGVVGVRHHLQYGFPFVGDDQGLTGALHEAEVFESLRLEPGLGDGLFHGAILVTLVILPWSSQ